MALVARGLSLRQLSRSLRAWTVTVGALPLFVGRGDPVCLVGNTLQCARGGCTDVRTRALFAPHGKVGTVPRQNGLALRPSRMLSLHLGPTQVPRRSVGTIAEAAVDAFFDFAWFAAEAYAGVLLLLFFLQRRLLFIPPAVPSDPALSGGELVLIGEGVSRLAAVYFPPPSDTTPVFVFFHGNADQIGWGPAQLGKTLRDRFGAGFLGIEYPGYGYAGGKPTETSIYEASERLLRHVSQERGIHQERVVLFGQSLGCAVAVEMAQRGFGTALVLASPFLSVPCMAMSLYPFVAPVLHLAPVLIRDRFESSAKAAILKVPTLVVHGQEDEVVSVAQGRELARLISGAELHVVQAKGHNDVLDGENMLSEIVRWATLRL